MAKGKRASRSMGMGKVQEAVREVIKKHVERAANDAAAEEPKQEGLFGPADEIVNALELARSRVLLDIDGCVTTITKKQRELEYLDKIRKQYEEAIVIREINDLCVTTITKKQRELEYLDKVRKQYEEAIVKAKVIAEEQNAEEKPDEK